MPLDAFLIDKDSVKHDCWRIKTRVLLACHSGRWKQRIWAAGLGVVVGELTIPSVQKLW